MEDLLNPVPDQKADANDSSQGCRRAFLGKIGALSAAIITSANSTIPDPVMATNDGLFLIPYSGPALTLGGELNKLATNIAIGRDHAGVHWRSDALASLALGEAIAISVMRDQKLTYNERFHGFSFTKFDGTSIIV